MVTEPGFGTTISWGTIPSDVAAGGDAELAEDRGHVVLDRTSGEDEALGDRGVGQALAKQLQDLGLPAGQAVRVGAGVGTPAAGRGPSLGAGDGPGPGGRRLGAEVVEGE